MRFGINATSVEDVNKVANSLITSRKVIFTPNVDIKQELKNTSISITCYDRNGNLVKRVTSADDGTIEDPDNPSGGSDGGSSGGTDSGSESGGSDSGGSVLD